MACPSYRPSDWMSFSTPAAVTSGPAPGPATTSGSVRYRRVVNESRLRVPLRAPSSESRGTAREGGDDAAGGRAHDVAQHAAALPLRLGPRAPGLVERRQRLEELLDRHAAQRRRHEVLGRGHRALVAEEPAEDQALAQHVAPERSSRGSGSA